MGEDFPEPPDLGVGGLLCGGGQLAPPGLILGNPRSSFWVGCPDESVLVRLDKSRRR